MIVAGTLEAAVPSPDPVSLEQGYLLRKTLFSSPCHERPSPHAYLIEQSPHSHAQAHFHHDSEFQVIVRGSGQLGRHDVRPFMVHYAGQQTGYGPIVAGGEGLAYLTLRPVTASGIWFLPESRPLMDPRIRRGQLSSAWLAPSDQASLARQQGTAAEVVLEPRPDGLAAWRLKAAPGMPISPPRHGNGAGRFHMVAGGSLRWGGRDLPELATLWVSNDEAAFDAVAGERGLDVLVMQFPADAWAFPDPPQRLA